MTSTPEIAALQRRHLRIGWGSLLLFVVLGGVLEAMHGFKVDWYLSVGNETQRLLWRLAHAHGTFLSLVHIGLAVSIAHMAGAPPRLASACLTSALVALRGGGRRGEVGVDEVGSGKVVAREKRVGGGESSLKALGGQRRHRLRHPGGHGAPRRQSADPLRQGRPAHHRRQRRRGRRHRAPRGGARAAVVRWAGRPAGIQTIENYIKIRASSPRTFEQNAKKYVWGFNESF